MEQVISIKLLLLFFKSVVLPACTLYVFSLKEEAKNCPCFSLKAFYWLRDLIQCLFSHQTLGVLGTEDAFSCSPRRQTAGLQSRSAERFLGERNRLRVPCFQVSHCLVHHTRSENEHFQKVQSKDWQELFLLAPTLYPSMCVPMWVSCAFESPSLYLFNLDGLQFAYLLTSRYWQLRSAGVLKACMPARRRFNEEHAGSPALLWRTAREAADSLISPSSLHGFAIASLWEKRRYQGGVFKSLSFYFLPSDLGV